MKFVLNIIFSFIFLFSCDTKKKEVLVDIKNRNFDSIIKIASNKNNTLKVRLASANSAFSLIKSKDSVNLNQYNELASIYFRLRKKQEYLVFSKWVYDKGVTNRNYELSSNASYCIANYFYSEAKYDSAYLYFDKCEKDAFIEKDFSYYGYLKNVKANILVLKKDFASAEKMSIDALKISKKTNYMYLTYNCYLTLGNTTLGLENYNKSISYFQKATELSDKLQNETTYLALATQPLNFLSTVYRKKKDYKTALLYAQKGLAFDSLLIKEPEIYCYLKNNFAYSKFQLSDKSANKLFLQTLELGDSLKFAPIQITSKMYLGEYYIRYKDTIKANFYLKNAQNLAHKNAIFEDELTILKLLTRANPKKATFYNNRYISLNDSLQTVERATRDKFARIEFETEEITVQKNKAQNLYENLNTKFLLLIGFAVFLLTTLYYWFTNKANKAKTRELLLVQEHLKDKQEIYQLMLSQQQKIEEGKQIEKQRISQELHDGVMGKLSSIRMNLFVLNKKNDPETIAKCLEYVNEIQNIEKEIRKIAHDLNKNLLSDNINFVTIVENLFTAIKSHNEINFNLKVEESIDWEKIDNNAKINIYRIIQEALQNIDKYAKAKTVKIIMYKKDTNVLIDILDDGIGFNNNIVKDGIGLKNMKNRMLSVGGTFNIESFPNKGTKINLLLPN